MPKKKQTALELSTFILIYRSGSMAGKWEETISSINSYVQTMLEEKNTKNWVTVATFDSNIGIAFDVIRDTILANDYKDISSVEISPRGYTPLYDAIGKVVTLADKENKTRTMIVVMTDGEENSSRELTKDGARATLQRCKDKGWQVVFLGADFDAFSQSGSVGVSVNSTLNMTAGNYSNAMRSMASSRTSYTASGSSVTFSDADRAVAEGKSKLKTIL